jgi:hypothetical protein
MGSVFGALLGSAAVLWWIFAIVVSFVFAGVLPFMAFKALRAIVGIERELARLNANLEHGAIAAPPLERDGRRLPTYQTATGPLGRMA